jgi:hypothetical protein
MLAIQRRSQEKTKMRALKTQRVVERNKIRMKISAKAMMNAYDKNKKEQMTATSKINKQLLPN